MKKILSIIGIAIVVVALGLFGYYYFLDKKIDPSTGTRESFREFLPFGSNTHTSPGGTQDGNNGNGNFGSSTSFTNPNQPLQVLQQITSEPVAGATMILPPLATSTLVRYVDRATGNIYDYDIPGNTLMRRTITTIPKVRETVWSPDGSSVIMRFLENGTDFIDSYYATFDAASTSTTPEELTGDYLPANLTQITALGSSKNIFSLTSGQSGASGFVSPITGGSRTLVFQSPISEWDAQGISPTKVALTTKPAGYTNGFLYFLDTNASMLTKILGNVQGLTTLTSHSGNYVLFSENNNGYTLKLLDVDNKEVIDLGLNTVPEKCAWSSDDLTVYCAVSSAPLNADYLDLWYQGVVSTSDDIWKIKPVERSTELAYKMADKNIDGINLSVDSVNGYVSFMNKKDLSLWVLRVPQDIVSPDDGTTASTTE